jgi:hypothetical protein
MGKISAEAKKRYFDKVKEYKQVLDSIAQREKNLLQLVEKDDSGKEYKKIALADESLNLASYLILLNEVSLSFSRSRTRLPQRSPEELLQEHHLPGGRRNQFHRRPYSDYKEKLEKIEGLETRNDTPSSGNSVSQSTRS